MRVLGVCVCGRMYSYCTWVNHSVFNCPNAPMCISTLTVCAYALCVCVCMCVCVWCVCEWCVYVVVNQLYMFIQYMYIQYNISPLSSFRGPTESFTLLPSGSQDLCLSTSLCQEGLGILHDPPGEASVRHNRREMAPPPLELSSPVGCTRMATPHPEILLTPSGSRLHRAPKPSQLGMNSDERVGQSNSVEGGVTLPPAHGVPLYGHKETPISLGRQEARRSLETVTPPENPKAVGHLDRQKQLQSWTQCTTSMCSNPLDLRAVSAPISTSLDLQIGLDGQVEQPCNIVTPNVLQMFIDTHWWRHPHSQRMQPHPQVMFPSTVSCVWEGVWSSSHVTVTTDPVLPPSDRAVMLQHYPSAGCSGVSLAIPGTELPQDEAVCEAYWNACSSCLCTPDSSTSVVTSSGMSSSPLHV